MDTMKLADKAKFYKNAISSRYLSISPEDITSKINNQDSYFVSTKLDGHFYLLGYENNKAFLINHKGKVVENIDILDIAIKIFNNLNIKSIIIAGELYLNSDDRTRSFDLTKALSEKNPNINFGVFDILEIEEEIYYTKLNSDRVAKIEDIFENKGKVHHVQNTEINSREKIANLFDEIVLKDKAEGLVVRTEQAIYKLKPKYTFDATIIGFAKSDGDRSDMFRDLLIAFMHEDGSYQIIGHLHHGFSEVQRKELCSKLDEKTIPSEYIEVATNKVAFKFIKPDIVLEFSCLDLINEDSKGPITKMCLKYDEENGYSIVGKKNSISVTSPNFIRFRTDKTVSSDDIRFSQVKEVISFDGVTVVNEDDFADSEIIKKEVYTKTTKDLIAVRKFVIIKTNKEDTGKYPAYVLFITDFSAGRKEPLSREVKLSNSLEQIENLWEQTLSTNIKKGWDRYDREN